MSYKIILSNDELTNVLIRETLRRYDPSITDRPIVEATISHELDVIIDGGKVSATLMSISVEINSIDGKKI